jgi:phosphoglycolate phosphatase-like HAD superfamily hydrolase
MNLIWVFDIDGTLADCTHRLHFIKADPPDWRAFFASVAQDAPIPHMVELVRALIRDLHGPGIGFVSGRSDECRSATTKWLVDNISVAILGTPLYMRRAGDYRDDEVVKVELLEQLRRDGLEPLMVFDDRNRVVQAWRGAGVPCAQVAPGDF